jgi:hypothetical protein
MIDLYVSILFIFNLVLLVLHHHKLEMQINQLYFQDIHYIQQAYHVHNIQFQSLLRQFILVSRVIQHTRQTALAHYIPYKVN